MTHVTAPIILLGGAAALIIIIVCVYLLAYRAHINRALKNGGERPMAAPRTVLAVSAVAVLLCAAALGYAAGYKAAYDDFEGTSSPAVEIPPMTLRDLSALPELFDAALEHVRRDEAEYGNGELINARAELTDLAFLDGGFSYFSFTLCYGSGGGRITRSVDVNAAGAVFTERWTQEDGSTENSVPLETFRRLLAALDGVDWPEGGEVSAFQSMFGSAAQSPGGYVLSGGALLPSADASGEYRAVDFTSGGEVMRIYIQIE